MACTWMFYSLVVVMASVAVGIDSRLLRVKRIVCGGGRLSMVNEVCRWNDLECACVAGAFCSWATHICEVCQPPSANCTSRCAYECLNGGHCDQATGTCLCPPGHGGLDCGSPAAGLKPPATATTMTKRPQVPGACGQRKCLNGGTCHGGDGGPDGGTCVCPVGYYLPDCSLCLPRVHPRKCLDHCDMVCDHGDCLTEHRKCHCSLDYTGVDCSLCIPAVAHGNCTAYCSPMCRNGATCNTATGKCECKGGWRGEDCRQACPHGTFGPNCLRLCRCPAGPCDPVTGQCLCDRGHFTGSQGDCKPPCDCLLDGVCYPKDSCQDGKKPVPTPAISGTTPAGELRSKEKDKSTGDGQPSMMMPVIVTSGGVVVLLIVVVILVVCLARSRRERTRFRKPGRTEEVERVPMTVSVAGNNYDDASSKPMLTAAPTAPPCSGYEDVSDLHCNLPDLLPASSGDISPYATTGNTVTIHADTASSQYAYASVDELKTMKEAGEAALEEGAYKNLDFRKGETSLRRPAVADATYSSLQDEDTYLDASSCDSRGSLGHLVDADVSGYAKMSPSTVARKAMSLKSPTGKDNHRQPIQRKAASMKLSKSEASSDQPGTREAYENAYVGFDPEGSARGARRKPSTSDPPPPPSPDSIPTQPSLPASAAALRHKAGGSIPHYAKPNKGRTQTSDKPKPIPHYAKPNKPKNHQVPQYAQPDQITNKAAPSEDNLYDQLERPHGANKGKSTPGTGYAHLMHAVSPSPRNNMYEYPSNE